MGLRLGLSEGRRPVRRRHGKPGRRQRTSRADRRAAQTSHRPDGACARDGGAVGGPARRAPRPARLGWRARRGHRLVAPAPRQPASRAGAGEAARCGRARLPLPRGSLGAVHGADAPPQLRPLGLHGRVRRPRRLVRARRGRGGARPGCRPRRSGPVRSRAVRGVDPPRVPLVGVVRQEDRNAALLARWYRQLAMPTILRPRHAGAVGDFRALLGVLRGGAALGITPDLPGQPGEAEPVRWFGREARLRAGRLDRGDRPPASPGVDGGVRAGGHGTPRQLGVPGRPALEARAAPACGAGALILLVLAGLAALAFALIWAGQSVVLRWIGEPLAWPLRFETPHRAPRVAARILVPAAWVLVVAAGPPLLGTTPWAYYGRMLAPPSWALIAPAADLRRPRARGAHRGAGLPMSPPRAAPRRVPVDGAGPARCPGDPAPGIGSVEVPRLFARYERPGHWLVGKPESPHSGLLGIALTSLLAGLLLRG